VFEQVFLLFLLLVFGLVIRISLCICKQTAPSSSTVDPAHTTLDAAPSVDADALAVLECATVLALLVGAFVVAITSEPRQIPAAFA